MGLILGLGLNTFLHLRWILTRQCCLSSCILGRSLDLRRWVNTIAGGSMLLLLLCSWCNICWLTLLIALICIYVVTRMLRLRDLINDASEAVENRGNVKWESSCCPHRHLGCERCRDILRPAHKLSMLLWWLLLLSYWRSLLLGYVRLGCFNACHQMYCLIIFSYLVIIIF